MPTILDHCRGLDQQEFETGAILIKEGTRSGRLFVLVEGTCDVFRTDANGGEVEISVVDEPGAIFGEMSVLLGLPHTASVRSGSPVRAFVIEGGAPFLQSRPEFTLPIARLLARRLHSATTYLVNLKQQYRDFENHFGMVDEVLESLTHQQDDDFTPAGELPTDPRL